MGSDPWSLAADLRPRRERERLSLAAQLDAARAALLLVEAALTNGIPVVGSRRKWNVKVRDGIILTAVRNVLGLMDDRGVS